MVFLQKHIKKHVRVFLQCRINSLRLSFELPVELVFKYKIKSLFVVILYAMKCDPAWSLNPRCLNIWVWICFQTMDNRVFRQQACSKRFASDSVVSEKEFQTDEAIIAFYQNDQKSLNLFGWTRSGLFFINFLILLQQLIYA